MLAEEILSPLSGREDRRIASMTPISSAIVRASERFLSVWLCHSDARQVSDLPDMKHLMLGLRPLCLAVRDRHLIEGGAFRQVEDLPRIGVAEPYRKIAAQLSTA